MIEELCLSTDLILSANVHLDVMSSTCYDFTTLSAGWHRRNVMITYADGPYGKRRASDFIWRFKKHGVTTVGNSLFLIMKMGFFEIRVD